MLRNFRSHGPLRVDGEAIVDGEGNRVVLRGVGLGGWMNMENFITGYPATESQMRASVDRGARPRARGALLRSPAHALLRGRATRALLAELGVNCVRIPVNYRHFERDDRPFELREEGFERLDRVVRLCAEHGIYSVIDLHAVPGCQNQHWHSDNPTHIAAFWQHPHFQDRVVHLWQAFATRYRDEPWIGGYNLLNEPADPSGAVVGPFHDRLVAAVREIDPDHIVFVDGNTYSTDFSMFAEPYENAVYACHDYARAGHGLRRPVPGRDPGPVDRPRLPRGEVPRALQLPARDRARRSGSASSARSTPATPSATSSATRSSPTSSTSTTATARGGRSGPTRTSGCRGSSTPRPTARTCSASAR